jgi:hypothetical protein
VHPQFDDIVARLLDALPDAQIVFLEVCIAAVVAALHRNVSSSFLSLSSLNRTLCLPLVGLCVFEFVFTPTVFGMLRLCVCVQGLGAAWSTQVRLRLSRRLTCADAARVVFLERLSAADYAQMLIASDVLLDTTPYSSFSISVEALSLGTPIVTLRGRTVRRCGLAVSLCCACWCCMYERVWDPVVALQ